MFVCFQGLQAITLRLDGAVSKLEGKAANQEATTSKPRRTSSLSRARASEGHRAADSSAGMKLMRMYTIDQDQFFPDLPALIQVFHFYLSLPLPYSTSNFKSSGRSPLFLNPTEDCNFQKLLSTLKLGRRKLS